MPPLPQSSPVDELHRALGVVRGLVGHRLATLSLGQLGTRYARFLAQKVSTLSPLIASLVEIAIVEAVNQEAEGFEWIRQEPAFPDAAMLDTAGTPTDHGLEVKAWHVLSTEITGRFKESRNRLIDKEIHMVIAAWALDHVVWGTPTLLGVYTVPALEIAETRDRHYYDPPRYLIVEPGDTAERTRNLQQTLVEGYRLQEANEHMITSAEAYVRAKGPSARDPYTPEGEALVSDLMGRYDYRLETNFAKIDRIGHEGLERFKTATLAGDLHGRSIDEWRRAFRALTSARQGRAAEATALVTPLFEPE